MKILITGSNGFVGKNLVEFLKTKKDFELCLYDTNNTLSELDEFCKDCNFVVNLAGINRTNDSTQFLKGNLGVVEDVVNYLVKNDNRCPILYSSSIQAELDNDYGRSKKQGEDFLFKYSNENDVPVYVYRFPNLFGKWSKPNYNTVIATFCYNIARDIEIQISDRNKELTLAYIDDVVKEVYNAILGKANKVDDFCEIPVVYTKTLGEIADLIFSFKQTRQNLAVINTADEFEKKLYSTYLSFLPEDKFSYNVKSNIDNRGSFTELIKTDCAGQFSVNVARPGIVKGNHWHNTKNEKFIVVKGKAEICFRKPFSQEVIKYVVSEDDIKIVDIPCGYTHNIKNIGDTDMVFFIWCNECFDENLPEETNRRIVDHISDINMCYSEHARRYLNYEGTAKERTFVTGSPMAEVLRANIKKIESSKILETLGLEKKKYILLSAHREENIDNEANFMSLMTAVNKMAEKYNMPIIYSTHPRSANYIKKRNFKFHPLVKQLKPFGFSDYNNLQLNAFCVVSDSGTLPEESSFFHSFPAVCIRTSTERPEALDKGNFVLAGITEKEVLQAVDLAVSMQENNDLGLDVPNYVDDVSNKVVKLIQSYTTIVNKMVWRK